MEKRKVGRPRSKPTRTKTFRIDAEVLGMAEMKYGKLLNRKINAYLKRII